MGESMNVNQFIDEYLSCYVHYKDYWKSDDGCIMMGCKELHEATKDDKYLKIIEEYSENIIASITSCKENEIRKIEVENINAGKVLFYIYNVTGDIKYKQIIEVLMKVLKQSLRTHGGNFTRDLNKLGEVYLRDTYYTEPFYMAYETQFNGKENYNDIIGQFESIRDNMFNKEKGLYVEAYDETKSKVWASKATGMSKVFYLRAVGYYLMALIDTMQAMSIEIFEHYKALEVMFKEAIKGVLKYQDSSTKMFHQIIDDEGKDNYLETAGSSMIAYAILKACQMGVLSKEKYEQTGIEIIEAVITNKLLSTNEEIHLKDFGEEVDLDKIADLSNIREYYLGKTMTDDPKGVGLFMAAYAQLLKIRTDI